MATTRFMIVSVHSCGQRPRPPVTSVRDEGVRNAVPLAAVMTPQIRDAMHAARYIPRTMCPHYGK